MQTETITTRILRAEDDRFLTQSAEGLALMERVVTTMVYLAPDEGPEVWKEITRAEGERIIALQQVTGELNG